MNGLIILNPVMNRFKKRVLQQLRLHLQDTGEQWQWFETTGSFESDLGAIQGCISDNRIEQALVLGGDGTLHLAANAMAFSNVPVGYIPCGSGNDFARFWYGARKRKNIETLITTALQGEAVAVDLGHVGDRYFVNVAGLGFDGALIQQMRNRKLWFPVLSYIVFALFMLPFYQGKALSLKAAGKKLSGINSHKSFLLSLGNAKYYGGGLPIAPHANAADGLLAWCHIEDGGVIRNTGCLLQLLCEKHLNSQAVRAGQTDSVSILTEGIPVQADGEYLGQTPAVFSVKKQALLLRAPV